MDNIPAGRAVIAAQLHAARLAAGLNQHEVARRANVASATVIRVERGNNNVSLDIVVALASVYGLEVVLQRRADTIDSIEESSILRRHVTLRSR